MRFLKLGAMGAVLLFLLTTVSPAVLNPAPPVASAVPCQQDETQSWWNEAGQDIPRSVGEHIHFGVCWPAYGNLLPDTMDMTATVILHAAPAGLKPVFLRGQWGLDGHEFYKRTSDLGITLDASRNGTRTFVVPLDFRSIPAGSHEFRFSYRIDYSLNGTSRTQYQSFGLQGCVRSCANPERSNPWWEGRSWYTGRAYQNARLRTDPLQCLKVGATCKAEMKPGSGGKPTVQSWAVIDPDFHHGLAGLVLPGFPKAGPFSGNITIPSLTAGTHKLVLVASDGKNAVANAFTFIVP